MKVIGLIGGIGSGKSTVGQFLAELGAVILDADKVGHEAYKPGTEIWREVVATFGRQIVTSSGDIDRKKLGEMVFGNPESLARLKQIMYPRINKMLKARIEEYRRQGVSVVVFEVPLLVEAPGWISSLVDEVWVTLAAESAVLKRVKAQVGLSGQQISARIRSQLSPEERVKHADVVIKNDGNLDELKARVRELWQGFQV